MPYGDTLSGFTLTANTGGIVSWNSPTTILFTPNIPNWCGTGIFTYNIQDSL